MIRRLTLGLVLAVVLVLETTIFKDLTVYGVEPDLVLIVAIAYALINGPEKGAIFGFIGGLAQDIMTGRYLGMNALSKALSCYLVGQVEQKVYKEHALVSIFFVCLGTLINELIVYIVGNLVGLDIAFKSALWNVILPMMLYNGLLSPIIYHYFYRSSVKGWLKKDNFGEW